MPYCTGLKKEELELSTSHGIHTIEISEALGLSSLPFATGKINRCASFTKCVRGKSLETSGDEPFNGIVLPMVKAAHHFKERAKAPRRVHSIDCHLLICLAVIGAPMVGVHTKSNSNELVMLPWIRVHRSLAADKDIYFGIDKEISIDFVHKDYLANYIKDHLFPFAEEFKNRVMRHQQELFRCKGRIKDIEGDIEKDLRPL